MDLWTLEPDEDPIWDARLVDREGDVRAMVSDRNPLSQSGPPDLVTPPRPTAVVLRTGWLDGPDHPDDGVFHSGFRTWTATGWEAFNALLPPLEEEAVATGRSLWLRPHARHVLSDAQGTLSAVRSLGEASPVGLLLDPAGMLTASMLDAAEDHLNRIAEALLEHPRTAAVVITGAELVEVAGGGGAGSPELRPVPVHHGALPAQSLRDIAHAAAEAGKPLVLLGSELDEQRAALEL